MAHQKHDCPCCTCGLIEVLWSDRSMYIDPDSPEDVVEAICHCVFDRYYDRTASGVPYGLSRGIQDAVAPVIAKHLSAVWNDWTKKDKDIYMTADQRLAFHDDLLAALTEMRENLKHAQEK